MTSVKRRGTSPAFNPFETLSQHLVLKSEAKTITSRADSLKAKLKAWLPDNWTSQNENGSLFWDAPETITDLKGVSYSGMELRKAQPEPLFNEEKAEKILRRKGVLDEALSSYVDQDKVYLLVQEGKITEADLDKMLDPQDPTWSFWPVTGEVEE